ncbi:MAG TPA: hypothetical protein VJG29_00345 [Candidatus Paceibacterota bacterium]
MKVKKLVVPRVNWRDMTYGRPFIVIGRKDIFLRAPASRDDIRDIPGLKKHATRYGFVCRVETVHGDSVRGKPTKLSPGTVCLPLTLHPSVFPPLLKWKKGGKKRDYEFKIFSSTAEAYYTIGLKRKKTDS